MSTKTRTVGTWDTLKLSPSKLMKMVLRGEATIVGKDRFGRRIYELARERSEDARKE